MTVDPRTFQALRGRYARFYVEMDFSAPLPSHIKINHILQSIAYENIYTIFFHCVKMGHRETSCSEKQSTATQNTQSQSSITQQGEEAHGREH